MELNKLLSCKEGDIIILNDYNALEQLGKPFEAQIVNVCIYTLPDSNLKYHIYTVTYEDLELRLIVKTINGEYDIKMYTTWSNGLFRDFINEIDSDSKQTEVLPTIFIIDPSNGDNKDFYISCEPYPLYGFKSNTNVLSSIGEYVYDGEADSTYCSKYAFIEWYMSEDIEDDDLDCWYSLSFGWDVSLDDLSVIQG